MSSYIIAALYKFVSIPDYRDLQRPLLDYCQSWGVKGTLILAAEGINGTISGTRASIDASLSYLKTDARFQNLEHKESYSRALPFYRMKVKLKREIVTIGIPDIDPTHGVGTYVAPDDWNSLVAEPDVLLLDTRNRYETKAGIFRGAVDPMIDSFREFPTYTHRQLDPHKNKRIAMYCTGGIRCEKASAFLLRQGFSEVYQLQGGILKYLETIPAAQSLWQGECFVFDNRVTVSHGLQDGSHSLCYGCRYPISQNDKLSPFYKEGISCPNCYPALSETKRNSAAERHRQVMLAAERNQQHIGPVAK